MDCQEASRLMSQAHAGRLVGCVRDRDVEVASVVWSSTGSCLWEIKKEPARDRFCYTYMYGTCTCMLYRHT